MLVSCSSENHHSSENSLLRRKSTMAAEEVEAATALAALGDQQLRSHIESAAAGKTNLTTEQLVDLLFSAFPEEYSCENRELLTERVAKISPLPRCSGDAATNKRRRTEELGNGEGVLRAASGNNRPRFRDLVGMENVIDKLRREVIVPLHQWKLLHHLGVKSIPRILLHGPPKCGKTTLVRALANEAGYPLHEISAADLVSRASGAPEENIRELFSTVYMREPSIVFIDEIDAMTSKMESLRKDIVNWLMASMDPYRLLKPVNHDAGSESSNSLPGCVLVIGATSNPDALDPVLRRQFDREIVIDVPDFHDRDEILSVLTRNLRCDDICTSKILAKCTLGFVLEDLIALAELAATCAANRIMKPRKDEFYTEGCGYQIEDCFRKKFSDEEMKNLRITEEDFVKAAKRVQPSSRLEGFSTTPDAEWDDVGGLQLLKLEFERHIVKRIKFPEVYKDLWVNLKSTFFLYGPSGCGKTLIVEALANEAGANFLHIKGSELLGFYDQGELVMHVIFNYARSHCPCIIFFDQLEGIYKNRGKEGLADFGKLVRQLGFTRSGDGVYVIYATNRAEDVKDFVSSTEYYEKRCVYVPLPTPEERGAILKALARNKPIDADVDLIALGKDIACENLSGARLSYLMKDAIKAAIDRPILSGGGHSEPWTIKDVDFKNALKELSASHPTKEMKKWEDLAGKYEKSGNWWC